MLGIKQRPTTDRCDDSLFADPVTDQYRATQKKTLKFSTHNF